jgi:D-aspartate ligase
MSSRFEYLLSLSSCNIHQTAKEMSQNRPPVVIVGLNDASLSIVRSLGSKGIQIIGLYENAKKYYINSKFICSKLEAPLEGEPLVKTLVEKVADRLKEEAVLFCGTDSAVLSVSKHAKQLRNYFKFVMPPYEVTNNQISKKEFHKFAIENSFLVPNTFFAKSVDEIGEVIESITFPWVIKPEFRDRMWYENVPVKVLYAETKEDFLNLMNQYKIQQTSLVIQEWIDGGDTEVYFCLAYISGNHRPLATCVGRKLRQHPHLTGSTSIAETVCIPEMASESIRLLNAAGCVGFCSVEFKRSKKDGRYFITEPTVGRPDTQEGIFMSAGIDVPYIAYLDALGCVPNPIESFKKDIKWINEPLAFYSFQDYLRNGFNVMDFLSLCRGKRSYALWARNDPMPLLSLCKEKMIKGVRKLNRIAFRKKGK